MFRKSLILILALVLIVPVVASAKVGFKEYNLGIYPDEILDVGTREQFWTITADGPMDPDGTPAVGATQWLRFALWDYVGTTWTRVWPTATTGATEWTVGPGDPPLHIDLGTARASRIRFNSGASVADSLGARVSWGVK